MRPYTRVVGAPMRNSCCLRALNCSDWATGATLQSMWAPRIGLNASITTGLCTLMCPLSHYRYVQRTTLLSFHFQPMRHNSLQAISSFPRIQDTSHGILQDREITEKDVKKDDLGLIIEILAQKGQSPFYLPSKCCMHDLQVMCLISFADHSNSMGMACK